MKIDDLDFKIIAELKKDSRLSMRELGRKISLSAPSVTERSQAARIVRRHKKIYAGHRLPKGRSSRFLHH